MISNYMDAFVRWQEAPTSITSLSHNPILKNSINAAVNVLSSKTFLGIATGTSAVITYAYPSVGTFATLFTSATLWTASFYYSNAQTRVAKEKTSLAKTTEDTLRQEFINLFPGKVNFSMVRHRRSLGPQPYSEFAHGEIQFDQSAFPPNSALVQAQNSQKQTVFGIRIQLKGEVDPSQNTAILNINFIGGKLVINCPDIPDHNWDPKQLVQLVRGQHPSFVVMAPQGLVATNIQGQVNNHAKSISTLEKTVTTQQKTIVNLGKNLTTAHKNIEEMRKVIVDLMNANQTQAAIIGQLNDRLAVLENHSLTEGMEKFTEKV